MNPRNQRIFSLGWIWELIHPNTSHGAQAVPSAAKEHSVLLGRSVSHLSHKARLAEKGQKDKGKKGDTSEDTLFYLCPVETAPLYSALSLHFPCHPIPARSPCPYLSMCPDFHLSRESPWSTSHYKTLRICCSPEASIL